MHQSSIRLIGLIQYIFCVYASSKRRGWYAIFNKHHDDNNTNNFLRKSFKTKKPRQITIGFYKLQLSCATINSWRNISCTYYYFSRDLWIELLTSVLKHMRQFNIAIPNCRNCKFYILFWKCCYGNVCSGLLKIR